MHQFKGSRLLLALASTAAVAALASTAAVAGGSATAKSDGSPHSTTVGSVAPSFLVNARTIPHWTFQYTDPANGVTYPITMVGADPKSGLPTSLHTVIVPLKLNFVAGNQDTSVLNDLGYVGFRATPLDPYVRRNSARGECSRLAALHRGQARCGPWRRHRSDRRRVHARAVRQDR